MIAMQDQVFYSADAAWALGVTPETLRGWRRRSVGPAYVKQRGGSVRSRSRGAVIRLPDGVTLAAFAGESHWCDSKPHGTVLYRGDALKAFIRRRMVPRGRLPRPLPGRLPGGKNGRPPSPDGGATPPVRVGTPMQGVQLLYSADLAAWLFGIRHDTLHSWRRRGIGPAHVRFPGGRIGYPLDELKAFAKLLVIQWGRMPYGKNRPAKAARPGGAPAP